MAEHLFLWGYHALWHLLLPLVLWLLWRKGKREPLYRAHWSERMGHVETHAQRPVWVHSSSMGELRGAAPLVQALLARGFPVLVTTFTPAGRNTAHRLFAEAMAQGQLQVAYQPLELGWAIDRFIRQVQPRCAIMTEIDTWPVLLHRLHRKGIRLVMANAQYPRKSLKRDLRWWGLRSAVFRCYDLVLCKSTTHAERFERVGCPQVVVAGETRFDLPVPTAQLAAAAECVASQGLHPGQRPVLCVASSVAGEDEQFMRAFALVRDGLKAAGLPAPLLVHVPRSPQRFDAVASMFQDAGWRLARRSLCMDANLRLNPGASLAEVDVLLGDSLGEMYFYLALSQAVVVGASFVPLGAHNVIEPLALKKPVMVGPSVWGIEYPGVEAMAAGVLQQLPDMNALADCWLRLMTDPQAYAAAIAGVERFYAEHAGATQRHLDVLLPWLEAR